MAIESLADVIATLETSNGMPPPEVEVYVRGYDFTDTRKEETFAVVDALLFSSIASVLIDVAPRLDLRGYRLDTSSFFAWRRHTGKVVDSLFDVHPSLIRSGACQHQTRAGESLAEWILWYSFDEEAIVFDRPRRSAALTIFEFAPSLDKVRRPELLLFCVAHLGGEKEIRTILDRTRWDINSSFDTKMMSGTTTGRPALGIATGYHDLAAVQILLRCGASPSVPVYDYRRMRSMVPLVEYASHYPQEIRAALEGAYLDRQRAGAQTAIEVGDSIGL